MTTLDHLTGGKAILGVGLGVPAEEEYGAFGEPIEAKVHAAMLDEALEVVSGLWSGEPSSFAGRALPRRRCALPPPTRAAAPAASVGRGPFAASPSVAPRGASGHGVVPLNPTGEPLTPEIVQQVVGVIAGSCGSSKGSMSS